MEDRRVAVIGLGYVGLPLAVALSEAGLEVVGIDGNAERVAPLHQGKSHIDDVDDGRLRRALSDGFRPGRFRRGRSRAAGRHLRLRPDR
jgi:UDP-N-acetyl-D-glucosamine dehydrogenase